MGKSKTTDIDRANLFPHITHPKKRAFLSALAQCGMLSKAARMCGWNDDRMHWHWIKDDPVYVAAVEEARQIAADHAEDEIYRRGVVGFDHPVTYEGKVTDNYTAYSDTLAIFYLKGARPEKYRDNFEGLPGGAKIQVNFIQFGNQHPAQLSPEAIPVAAVEGNGQGHEEGGGSVAPEIGKGQERIKFHHFEDVP